LENFLSITSGDTVIIRKYPELDFTSRDHQIFPDLPIWISWDTSAGMLGRSNPSGTIAPSNGTASGETLATPEIVNRIDVYPHVTAAFHWGGFSLIPSVSLRDTEYGETQTQWCFNGSSPATPGKSSIGSCSSGYITIPVASGQSINRFAHEFDFTLLTPSFERIFDGPRWFPHKIKHVIEPKVTYKYVGGIGEDFLRLVRFDDTEMYSNTDQVEVSLTNRLYVKRKDGAVDEILTWEVAQDRYFDPTFGGAIVPGERNVVLSSIELTPFAFLDRPRNYSPVVSTMRLSPRQGMRFEWRADYDPLMGRIVDSGFSLWTAFGKGNYVLSAGQNTVHTNPGNPLSTQANPLPIIDLGYPVLSSQADQINGSFHIGNQTRRGWNAGVAAVYDLREHVMSYMNTQITYNTDCCGLSFQFGRYNFGNRDETLWRIAFAVANLGSFGNLRKQDRLF
jgi:LPS-assembly protein